MYKRSQAFGYLFSPAVNKDVYVTAVEISGYRAPVAKGSIHGFCLLNQTGNACNVFIVFAAHVYHAELTGRPVCSMIYRAAANYRAAYACAVSKAEHIRCDIGAKCV